MDNTKTKQWAKSVQKRENGISGPEFPKQNERGTTSLANIFNSTGKEQWNPLVKKVSGENAKIARSLSRNAKSYANQGSLDNIFNSMGIFNKDVMPSGKNIKEDVSVKEAREARLREIFTSPAFQEGAIKLAFIRLIISGRIQYKESILGIFNKVIGPKYAMSHSNKLYGQNKKEFDTVLQLLANNNIDSFEFHFRGGIRKLAVTMIVSFFLSGIAPGAIIGILMYGHLSRLEEAERIAERGVNLTYDNLRGLHYDIELIYHSGSYVGAANWGSFLPGWLNSKDRAEAIADFRGMAAGKVSREDTTDGTYYTIKFDGQEMSPKEFLDRYPESYFLDAISDAEQADLDKQELAELPLEKDLEAEEMAYATGIMATVPTMLLFPLVIKLVTVYLNSSDDTQLIIDVLIKLLDSFIRSDELIFRALGSESIQNIPLLYNDPDAMAIFYKYVNEMKKLGVKGPKEVEPPMSMTNFLSGDNCSICQKKLAWPYLETTEVCISHHKFHIACIKIYQKDKERNFKCPICRTEILPFAKKIIREYSPLKMVSGGSKTRRHRIKKSCTKKYRK